MFVFSQMDLKNRFESVIDCTSVSVGSLEVYRPYPILRAGFAKTKFGDTVVLHLATSPTEKIKVFLPHRYGNLFTDTDVHEINNRVVSLGLIYKGRCPRSKCYLLSVEPS